MDNKDIIHFLKSETHVSPSKSAWRRIDPDNIVSVKLFDAMGFSADSYDWYHNGVSITEHQARTLLKDITK